jgi:hypothetical protein
MVIDLLLVNWVYILRQDEEAAAGSRLFSLVNAC